MDIRRLAFMAVVAPAALVAGGAMAQGRILYEERPYYRPAPYSAPATCNDRAEQLRERRFRIDDAMSQAERDRADIDRAAAELADQLRNLDNTNRAAVDAYNARSAEHNRRVAAHNDWIGSLNRSAARMNDDAAALNADCSYYRSWRWSEIEMLPAYRLR